MRIACLVVVLSSGCAVVSTSSMNSPENVKSINASMLAAQEMVALGAAARNAAELLCEPLLKHETSWEEERAIGQDLAITLAARTGHFYLEGVTETDPRKLVAKLTNRQTLTLPEGGKNSVSAHVAVVGTNLARYSARPDLPWVFAVIESDTANALSAPGGYVFVTTGLLKKMTNEAQLAGVLAHEISHVTQRTMLGKYRDAKHKQCVAANYAAWLIEHGGPRGPATDEMAKYARKFTGSYSLTEEDAGFMRFIMEVMMMSVLAGNDKQTEFLTDRGALELVSFAGYDALEYEKFLGTWSQEHHPTAVDRAIKLETLRKGELRDFVNGTARPDLTKVFAPLAAP